jgi:glycosyltransferase involved in cell wall biosynthesis
MTSKVTVLIPFYNPGRYLVEAIESVFSQTYKNWKLILINDASTDNSLSLIKKYLSDDRVSIVHHQHNLGQSSSLNTGLNLVDTPFIIQLDADDWFYKDTLKVLVKEANKLPKEVGLISGNINFVFENNAGKQIKQKIKQGKAFNDKYEFLLANRSVWPRFYRTAALKEVGGWPIDDPYKGRYVEDLRVLFYLIERYRFHWIDKPLLNHRRHADNQTNNEMELIGEVVEWAIKDTLKRWGNEFEPIITSDEEGWTIITGLKTKNRSKNILSESEPKSRQYKIAYL